MFPTRERTGEKITRETGWELRKKVTDFLCNFYSEFLSNLSSEFWVTEFFLTSKKHARKHYLSSLPDKIRIGNTSVKHRMNLSGSWDNAHSQHLQYLDSTKSSSKDVSLPVFERVIDALAVELRVHSYVVRANSIFSHVILEAMKNDAYPAWILT